MSEQLDRLEKLVESNAKAIESWANESIQYRRDSEERDRQIINLLDRLTSFSELRSRSAVLPAGTMAKFTKMRGQ